jgi:hypothetical protein
VGLEEVPHGLVLRNFFEARAGPDGGLRHRRT